MKQTILKIRAVLVLLASIFSTQSISAAKTETTINYVK